MKIYRIVFFLGFLLFSWTASSVAQALPTYHVRTGTVKVAAPDDAWTATGIGRRRSNKVTFSGAASNGGGVSNALFTTTSNVNGGGGVSRLTTINVNGTSQNCQLFLRFMGERRYDASEVLPHPTLLGTRIFYVPVTVFEGSFLRCDPPTPGPPTVNVLLSGKAVAEVEFTPSFSATEFRINRITYSFTNTAKKARNEAEVEEDDQ